MDFGQNTVIYNACEIARKLFTVNEKDEKSNGRVVRKCSVSYTHLRAHETVLDLVCRLLLEKKKETKHTIIE